MDNLAEKTQLPELTDEVMAIIHKCPKSVLQQYIDMVEEREDWQMAVDLMRIYIEKFEVTNVVVWIRFCEFLQKIGEHEEALDIMDTKVLPFERSEDGDAPRELVRIRGRIKARVEKVRNGDLWWPDHYSELNYLGPEYDLRECSPKKLVEYTKQAERARDYDKAILFQRTAADLEPHRGTGWFFLAVILERAGHLEEAIKVLEERALPLTEDPGRLEYRSKKVDQLRYYMSCPKAPTSMDQR